MCAEFTKSLVKVRIAMPRTLRFNYKYNVYLHVNISHTSEKEKIAFCVCCFCFTMTLTALQLLRLQWRIRSIYRCSLLRLPKYTKRVVLVMTAMRVSVCVHLCIFFFFFIMPMPTLKKFHQTNRKSQSTLPSLAACGGCKVAKAAKPTTTIMLAEKQKQNTH